MKRVLTLYLFVIGCVFALFITETSCHLSDPGMTNSSPAPAPAPSMGQQEMAPSVSVNPQLGTITISFAGNLNYSTGSALFTSNNNASLLVYSGGPVNVKGFNVGYGGNRTALPNTIVISNNGSSYESFNQLMLTGFKDVNGSAYQSTNYMFGQTSLTASLVATYDFANKRIVVQLPMAIVSSPNFTLNLYYTNGSGAVITPLTQIPSAVSSVAYYYSFSSDNTTLYINNVTNLSAYPFVQINNLYLVNSNYITYMALPVQPVGSVGNVTMTVTGWLNLSLQTLPTESTATITSNFTFTAPIWPMSQIVSQNPTISLNPNGSPNIPAPAAANLQKWANWNIKMGFNNVKTIALIDKTTGNTITNINIPNSTIMSTNCYFHVNSWGSPAFVYTSAKWEDILALFYPAVGTACVTNEFSTVIDLTSQGNAAYSYLGVDNPTVTVNPGATASICSVNWENSYSIPTSLNSDRLKIYDDVIFYGKSADMTLVLTGKTVSSSSLLYSSTILVNGSGEVMEDSIDWPLVFLDGQGLGIITAEMRTTVNLLDSGTFVRSGSTQLFVEHYSKTPLTNVNLSQVTGITLNLPAGPANWSSGNVVCNIGSGSGSYSVPTPLLISGQCSGYQDMAHTIYWLPLNLVSDSWSCWSQQTGVISNWVWVQNGQNGGYQWIVTPVYTDYSNASTSDYSALRFFPNACAVQ